MPSSVRQFRAVLSALARLDKSDLELALGEIARCGAETLQVECVSYWEIERGGTGLKCVVAYRSLEESFSAGDELLAEDYPSYFAALFENSSIVAHDVTSHPNVTELADGCFRTHGVTSTLEIPVWRSGQLAGVLCHRHIGVPRTWSTAEQDFAHGLANILMVALETGERHRAEQRYVMLARAVNDVLWDWNVISDQIEFSEAMASVFRFRPDDIRQSYSWWVAHVHRDDRDSVHASLVAALASREHAWSMQYRWQRGDGSLAVVLDRAYIARDGAGSATRVVGSMIDISERVEMEARLALSDRMASIGTLAVGVAHEINNPLTYVLENLSCSVEQLASSEPDLGDAIELLREAHEGAERIRRVVRDLQTFARPREDATEVLSAKSVIESTISLVWNQIRHRAQLLEEYGPSPNICIDSARLGQVVLNVLVNAAQAIPEGNAERNWIRIRTETARDGSSVIEVSDSGCGISPDVRSRIFEPFYTTKPVGTGTGLGLTISQSLVSARGGRIDIDSPPSGGCIVRIVLPAASGEPRVVPRTRTREIVGSRRRVMVIDDEALVRNVFRRMLEPHHDVVIADSGAYALEHMRSDPNVDVILCDLMMPQMSGIELYEEISSEHPALAGRVVFLTGGAFSERASEFVASCPRPVLEKPVRRLDLYSAIEKVGNPA